MSCQGTLQHLDVYSPPHVLKGSRGSVIGIIGTLMLVALCLALYVPPTVSYFKGNYYQSLYSRKYNSSVNFYSTDDFKIAVVFKDKITGIPIDHSSLLSLLNVFVTSKNIDGYYSENMLSCNISYFAGDIYGVPFTDCLVIPDYIQYTTGFISSYGLGYISVYINAPVANNPFYQTNAPLSTQQQLYINILNNCYIEFYFTSKVIAPDNTVKFQVHKVYSTQFDVGSQYISASFQIVTGMRFTTMDDSILPWRNLRNITGLVWIGQITCYGIYNSSSAISQGIQNGIYTSNMQEIGIRYYKKIDQLKGNIGGGIFLLYLIFYFVFNYCINRNLLKYDLPNELLLKARTTQNNFPSNHTELQAVNMPSFNLWVPFCKDKQTIELIEQAENQNDIVLNLKKIKVAARNLKKKALNPDFETKLLKLQGEEELYQQQTESASIQPSSSLENRHEIISQHSRNLHHNVRNSLNGSNLQQQSQNQSSQQEVINIIQMESQQNINGNSSYPVKLIQKDENKLVNRQVKQNISYSKPGHQQYLFLQKQQVQPQKQKSQRQMNNKFDFVQTYNIDKNFNQNRQQMGIEYNIELPINQQIRQSQHTVKIPNQDSRMIIIPRQTSKQEVFYQKKDKLLNFENNPLVVQSASIIPAQTNDLARQQIINIPNQLPVKAMQNQQIDQKFNLNTDQLEFIMTDNQIVPKYYENNHTAMAMRNEKPDKYQLLMKLLKYNKWQCLIQPDRIECLQSIGNAIRSFIRKLDLFGVRVDMIPKPYNSSTVGVCFTLLMVTLSILTFCLTCQNLGYSLYKISYDYLPIENIRFSRMTDNNFNMLVCLANPSYVLGTSRTANLNFFTVINGVTTTYSPVQMSSGDNTLNFYSNQLSSVKSLVSISSCFKMPSNVQVNLNQNQYFGYTITPFCLGTVSYCNSIQNITNANYVTALNNLISYTVVPGARLNDSTMNLTNDLFVIPYQTANYISFNSNLTLEETLQVQQVVLLDDTKFSFLRQGPVVKDANIAADLTTKRTNFKATTSSSPSYTFKVRPNQSQVTYTVYCRNIDFILGVIGGVFVIWYGIFKVFAIAYNRFTFYSYVAKSIYQQQGYDDWRPLKILAAINTFDCLVPKCFGWRRDVSRMKRVNAKIQKSLHHLSLLKYTDICYQLSSSFFQRLELKNLSLLYFREKISESDQVQGTVQSKPLKPVRQQDFVQNQLDDTEMRHTGNKIINQDLENEDVMNNQEQQLQDNRPPPITQNESQNIIPNQDKSYFCDMFEEPAGYSFNKQRYFYSVFGGICSLIMLLLVAILASYSVGLYLTNGGRTVSYQTVIDDNPNNPGAVQLYTGINFRFGLAFINPLTLVPFNISSYMGQIGISLLLQQFNRTNGIVTPKITNVPLIPCPIGYLQQWVSQTQDPSYFTNLQFAYCIPDNIHLQISGLPQSQILKTFKISIYNAIGNSSGFTTLYQLLNSSYVQFYFSSPQQNSINRTITYEINTIIFDYFSATNPVTPVEHNITFSKKNITYDDNAGLKSWIQNPLNQIAYSFDPLTTNDLAYSFTGNPNTQAWYNLSFSYSKRMQVHYITVPYFYEVFGMVGGILAVFLSIIGCIVIPFNRYYLKYLIGRQLYPLAKLKDKAAKQRVKKKKKTKTKTHRIDRQFTKQIYVYSEWDILKAYFASYWGDLSNNYNFSDTLRRVTLIQRKIQKDMNLVEFYKNLSGIRYALIKEFQKDPKVANNKITNIFLKHIINRSRSKTQADLTFAILNLARYHKLSQQQQMVISQAKSTRINIKEIFDAKYLQKIFDVEDDGRSVRLSNMSFGSMGFLGTTSIISSIASVAQQSQNQDI